MMASNHTSPVNHSAGPLAVGFLVSFSTGNLLRRYAVGQDSLPACAGVAAQLASRFSACAEALPGSAE